MQGLHGSGSDDVGIGTTGVGLMPCLDYVTSYMLKNISANDLYVFMSSNHWGI